MRYARDAVVPFAVALLVGCAAATQRAYIAPTNENITSDTEERQGDPPAHLIFVQNGSSVPITVFSTSLNGCRNVKQNCGPRPMKLRVPGGQRMLMLRVEPENSFQGFSYSFAFNWQADSSSNIALTALASAGAPRARELTRDDFRSLSPRIAALRAEPESLIMAPGERINLEQMRLLVVDSTGTPLGYTRWMSWRVASHSGLRFLPPGTVLAERRATSSVTYQLSAEAEGLMGKTFAEVEQPIVVRYRFAPDAPVFSGRVLDADTRVPLRCAAVALEDSAANVVNSERSDATGLFSLSSPRPGTYRVRIEAHGWVPAHGRAELAQAGETKDYEYLVRFTEQMLVSRDRMQVTEFEHATPAAVTSGPIGARPARPGQVTPIVPGVTLGGSESMPILGIISPRVERGTTWTQFVVDPDGRVDTTSLVLPPATPANARSTIVSVLPRVRFSPARESGTPVCELLRMQVNFSPR